jgi:hypothetical protein
MDISEISRLNSSRSGGTYVGFVNETVEDYLIRMLGPKHLPLAVVIPITIIYVTIFVSGVVGNAAVCVVIARNKSMRTATNYYLFSLAVSDLTLLLLGKCSEHFNAQTTDILLCERGCASSSETHSGEKFKHIYRGLLSSGI